MHFPLFILPFDHRSGFARELLHVEYPYSPSDREKAKALKRIIWEGFLLAQNETDTEGTLGVLVDEETGSDVLKAAKEMGVTHILTTEVSGKTFDFVHGDEFGTVITNLQPTFAKALVHYVLGDEEKNVDQRKKLKQLSDFCLQADIPFMLEVLTESKEGEPPIPQTLIELEEAGIKPAIWKIEGFRDGRLWKEVAKATDIPLIVLGRGQDREEVELWIKEAAQSGIVKGFAIGRTIFLKPLQDFVSGTIDEETAKRQIADNYLHFIDLWEQYV